MTIQEIKNDMKLHMGENATIKCSLGRNKYEKYNVKIKEIYNNIFLVELLDSDGIVKSFSYSDIITKTIKINY